jgi:hypothetical protein
LGNSEPRIYDRNGRDCVEERCEEGFALIHSVGAAGERPMMGERTVMREALFYGFSLERHVPADHMLRSIDRFVDLSEVRKHLEPYP